MSLFNPTRTVKKFKFLDYHNGSVTVSTDYTILEAENVEVFGLVVMQDNTDGAAKATTLTATIDGETFTVTGGLNDEDMYWVGFENFTGGVPAMGDLPDLSASTNEILFMFRQQDVAGGFILGMVPIKARSFKLEVNMGAVGANQEFYADVYYYALEVA